MVGLEIFQQVVDGLDFFRLDGFLKIVKIFNFSEWLVDWILDRQIRQDLNTIPQHMKIGKKILFFTPQPFFPLTVILLIYTW